MKRLLLSSVMILLALLYVSGQNVTIQVTGTVTDASNGSAVANHTVYIMTDSSAGVGYFNQVLTDAQGVYSDAVSVPANLQVLFYITTTDCNNNYLTQTGLSTNPPIIADFSICTGGPTSCSADFIAIPDSTNPTGTTTFYFWDNSSGGVISWAWDFGDGTTSTLQYPVHTFAQTGMYNVCLTITTATGCSSTYCSTVNVGVPQSCMAQFVAWPDSNNNSWGFYDNSIGNVIAWTWTFGDGTTSNLQYPTHTYAQNGTYLVCLTIFTSDSCSSSFCDSIFVGTQPNQCYTYFTYTTNNLSATFTAFSNGGTAPYTYFWDFGDGDTSTMTNITHVYATDGNYTVTLISTDATGCTSTYTLYIYVGNQQNGTIWGQVTADNSVLDQGWVFLFVDGGPANPMVLIDSTMVDSAGYYRYIILNPLPGTYYVLAAPSPNSIYFTTHLPTYYGNTIFWANATPINLVQPANPYNIALVPLIPPQQGNGNISGEVTTGGKFNAALSAPAPNIEVMLLSMSNSPLALDYSDATGHISFTNLAYGTYKVYAEISGLPTDPFIATLTANAPAINNVTVVITPNGVTTGIDDAIIPAMSLNKLYPNPVKDNVNLEFSLTKTTVMEISLLNLLGQKMISKSESFTAGSHHMNIQLQDMESGTYFLQLNTAEGTKMTRRVTIVK